MGEAHESAGTVTRPTESGEDARGTKYGARTGIAGSDGAGEAPGRRGYGWTQLLRQRIKGAQRYPELALRFGMEGTVEVEFEIARDGSVEWVRVTKSSGYPLLDEASVEAVKRAAPLPVVPGRIRIPISYRLRDSG
ncbi:MAG: energy transducer TonB [Candidatus Methylomirabilales bacterium]